MESGKDSLEARKKANAAWISASTVFVLMVLVGVFLTDAARDANGNRPPVVPVVLFTVVVVALLRKFFRDHYASR